MFQSGVPWRARKTTGWRHVNMPFAPFRLIVLPLFSPPLIHAEQSLSEHQQQRICQILET